MDAQKKDDLAQVLKAIFGKMANVRNEKVSVTTIGDVTPEQFTLLAQSCFVLGVAPSINRVGAGVKVAFSLSV